MPEPQGSSIPALGIAPLASILLDPHQPLNKTEAIRLPRRGMIMRKRSKRNSTQSSRSATQLVPTQFVFDGLTALVLLSCLVTLGCDTRPADDAGQGNQPDPEVGAAAQNIEPRQDATAQDVTGQQRSGGEQSSSTGAADGTASGGLSRSQLAAGAIDAPQVLARASLEPTQGNEARGSVEFVEAPHGIEIMVSALDLTPGTHGIHLHENGDCSTPDASSAGDHFSPEGDPHGAPRDEPEAHHAGDLGNLTADDTGNAEKQIADPELQIDGEYGVVGRAIIIHQGEDDLTSQPSGDSGDPVACGVIERVEAPTDRV
jgi:superoxide dismutase, Cu-Zn family